MLHSTINKIFKNLNKNVATFLWAYFRSGKKILLEFSLKNFSLHRTTKKIKVPKSTACDFLEKCLKLENGNYCEAKNVHRPKKKTTEKHENYICDSKKTSFCDVSGTSKKKLKQLYIIQPAKIDQFWSRKD